MNKRNLIIILCLILALIIGAILVIFSKGQESSTTLPITKIKNDVKTPPTVMNGRKVLNLPSGKENTALSDLKIVNSISEHWDERVEEILRRQGGDKLKDIKLEKIESIIWTHQNNFAVNAESVRITLTDQNGGDTSFRALVDSESGAIIQSWDQPIREESRAHESGIKIDPRYHQD